MCTLRIHKLRQHPTEILLLWRHGEQNALGAHVPVERLDICDRETQFDLSCWVLVGGRWGASIVSPVANSLQPGDSNFTFRPSTSRWNFTALSIVGDELNHIPELRSLQLPLPKR